MMDQLNNFYKIIENSEKILITSHIHPDHDAIGVALGMYDYLLKKYPDKSATVFMIGEKNDAWDFLKYSDQIKWVDDLSEHIEDFDTLIFLDGNSVGRFIINYDKKEELNLSKYNTICIDHHPNPPDEFDVDLSDNDSASATQLIYKLFYRDEPELLDKDIATILLIGIMGDTGTFRYIKHSNAETFTYAKELLEIGKFDVQELELKISQISEKIFDLFNILVKNTKNIQIESVPPLTYTFLPIDIAKDYLTNQIKDASAFYKTSILRQIKNHNWGFVVIPISDKLFEVSFRSTPGSPNVRLIAERFDGGGHFMAAGGKYEVKDEIKFDSENFCNLIIETIKSEPNLIELTEKSI